MNYTLMKALGIILILFLFFQCHNPNNKLLPSQYSASDFPGILDIKGIPDSLTDRSKFMFSDLGAWHGYALPENSDVSYRGSFIGPFIMTQDNGVWLSKALSRLSVTIGDTDQFIDLSQAELVENESYPHKLTQTFRIPTLELLIETHLIFITGRTSIIQVQLKNESRNEDISIGIRWKGDSFLSEVSFSDRDQAIAIDFGKNQNIGLITPVNIGKYNVLISRDEYSIDYSKILITPQNSYEIFLAHTFCFSETELKDEKEAIGMAFDNPKEHFDSNVLLWDRKIQEVIQAMDEQFQDGSYHRIAVKCLETLNNNYRSAAGFLKYSGLFPSYNYEWFNGFWAWDSWKHAVAIAKYNHGLAQDQIKAMYTFQNSRGMIADCVYRDTIIENHNWRDTKPPLSAWAIWKVYENSHDIGFLEEMLPKLEKYHNWWYQYRDHDQNGLCEYGSTDGTLIAAKWESGMDNAVRFDDTKIVRNNDHGWSMNRESVDLNSYLYAEKIYISKIFEVLENPYKQKLYEKEAQNLKTKIQSIFYDEETGWFYDIDLDTKRQLKDYGAEGWIPLWAEVATDVQASRVLETMIDTSKFATFIPFPTLAADHPRFKPDGGYWRGPVWLDQAYFAIKALKNYGFEEYAVAFSNHLFNRLEGLKDDNGPIWENYHPHTGKGMESKHFSWSAAHLLLLLLEEE